MAESMGREELDERFRQLSLPFIQLDGLLEAFGATHGFQLIRYVSGHPGRVLRRSLPSIDVVGWAEQSISMDLESYWTTLLAPEDWPYADPFTMLHYDVFAGTYYHPPGTKRLHRHVRIAEGLLFPELETQLPVLLQRGLEQLESWPPPAINAATDGWHRTTS